MPFPFVTPFGVGGNELELAAVDFVSSRTCTYCGFSNGFSVDTLNVSVEELREVSATDVRGVSGGDIADGGPVLFMGTNSSTSSRTRCGCVGSFRGLNGSWRPFQSWLARRLTSPTEKAEYDDEGESARLLERKSRAFFRRCFSSVSQRFRFCERG